MEKLIEHWLDLPGRGRTLAFERTGPAGAPTVVLLHGLAATGRLNWGPSYGPLAERFRVLSVDHRGHGRGLRTGRFRLEDCADDVAAITTALGAERFIAVGYSMGGPIATLVWRRHPQRVDGLVLCATACRFAGGAPSFAARNLAPVFADMVRMLPERARQGLLARQLSRIEQPEIRGFVADELGGHDPAAVVQAAGAVGSFSSRDWIAAIDVPTAVVVTTLDELVPPARQRRMAELIPAAEIFEVEADHIACVNRADLFVPALTRACLSVARRAVGGKSAPRRVAGVPIARE